jgi:hypothetical protein
MVAIDVIGFFYQLLFAAASLYTSVEDMGVERGKAFSCRKFGKILSFSDLCDTSGRVCPLHSWK